jgi:hypothetical protein
MRRKNEEHGAKPVHSASSGVLSEVLGFSKPTVNSKTRSGEQRDVLAALDSHGNSDPFVVPDEVKKTRAEEMREAAASFVAGFESVKKFMETQPIGSEEVTAKREIERAVDRVKRELFGDKQKQIKELAERLLRTVEQLE